MRREHTPDRYCERCGGRCQDPDAIATLTKPPLSLGPDFTGAGSPSFKPARKSGRFE